MLECLLPFCHNPCLLQIQLNIQKYVIYFLKCFILLCLNFKVIDIEFLFVNSNNYKQGRWVIARRTEIKVVSYVGTHGISIFSYGMIITNLSMCRKRLIRVGKYFFPPLPLGQVFTKYTHSDSSDRLAAYVS